MVSDKRVKLALLRQVDQLQYAGEAADSTQLAGSGAYFVSASFFDGEETAFTLYGIF